MAEWSHRGVVEETRFTEAAEAFRQRYSAFEDVLGRISWELARNPLMGLPLPGFPDFRVLTTEPLDDAPGFRVLYTFDTENVYLQAIELVPD
jgi:hypothetical protein